MLHLLYVCQCTCEHGRQANGYNLPAYAINAIASNNVAATRYTPQNIMVDT